MSSRPPVPVVPGAWPVAGHVPQLARRPLEFLKSLARYGDLVEIRLGTRSLYVATHPELARAMLVTNAHDFTRSSMVAKSLRFVGPILVATRDEPHLRQRRLMQPTFHRARLDSYVSSMAAAAEEVTASWSPGDVVAVAPAMTDVAVMTMTKSLFFSELGAEAEAVLRKVGNSILEGARIASLAPNLYRRLPISGNRFLPAVRTAITNTIEAYRADGRDHGDMLSMLMRAEDAAGNRLSDREICTEILGLAVAGIGGPAATATWALCELGRNPDIERRVHEELDTFVAGLPPTPQAVAQLTYTHQVVKETLRKYPGWAGMRRAVRATQLGEYTLPPGAEVIYSAYALQNDPRWYSDPERFDPDRWDSKQGGGKVSKGAWVPFSAGVYKCIGDAFAITETVTVIAVIASRWRLRPISGHSVREVTEATHVLPHKLRMTVEPRTAQRRQNAAV
ncbi:cytochrome P450 [Streptomyces sp. AV19]|uniref:cytochrome P450 n=1 Tax=Streptomyces sp. AV19 TaxID=2793068 RepID=UPI0018FECD5C|nr:cytochrome P450 [Streptomyces sp. AV19]MBH1939264.1 cytochrome P450 [Streptomyces sp. AV19]MDG4533644.1 cytochrome P450 [Streptomyces sp. AV19]